MCDDPFLPFDSDSYDPTAPQKASPAVLSDDGFRYIGQPLTIDAFAAYVASYRFGVMPPEYVVLHHTAIPAASYAPYGDPAKFWDARETGLTAPQIMDKRKRQLDGIQRYYAGLGWNAGPHLFIDERWIWLFTPMYDVGIHARAGNSYRDSKGKLHYSIGVEVVGFYEHQVWPPAVARNVGMALAMLRRRLGTFALDYRPGPRNTPSAHLGSLSSHRDYNKPECPGAAITEQFYTNIAQQCWRELLTPAPSTERWYTVKPLVTAGATIRSAPRTNAAVLGRLKPGDAWQGEPIPGQTVTIAGFGSSNVWIRSADMRCVWSGLLQERRTK